MAVDKSSKTNLVNISELEDSNEGFVAWYDAILNADYWFRLQNVSPMDAAKLFCQLDPSDKKCDPSLISNTETNQDDYYLLYNFFESISSQEKSMKLIEWLDLAKTNKLKFHSWILNYIKAVGSEFNQFEREGKFSIKKWTPEKLDEVYQFYINEKNVKKTKAFKKATANHYGVTTKRIEQLLKKYDEQKPNRLGMLVNRVLNSSQYKK